MNITIKTLITAMAITAMASCKSGTATQDAATTPPAAGGNVAVIEQPMQSALPPAVIYKTRADYSQNVPINMTDGGSIANYPHPSDITPSQLPIKLAQGYLLDRRGIGANVAFTSYTYDEYAALTQVPSTATLKSKIIDSQPLTHMYRLPITLNEALQDTAAVNTIINTGLHRCTSLLPKP
ncbi:MAG: hypothetical protein ACI308_06210 [Muribaculaceae bacterium]